jgi:hypothetical protein
MQRIAVFPIILVMFFLSACQQVDSKTIDKVQPAHVEHIEGSELNRVILTEKASKRLGIETASVVEVQTGSSGISKKQSSLPYSAVLYDSHGHTWVYITPDPLVFIRHQIEVDYIDGEQAILTKGPPVGALVVAVGAAELFGAEFEIGH